MTATWFSSLLVLSSILLNTQGQEECGLFYLAQPPTQLPCNPYLNDIRFNVRIECILAVDRSIGGADTDFEIRWFTQHGSESTPKEFLFNGTNPLSVRIDQPTDITTSLYVYQSRARFSDMNITVSDRFWCEVYVSDTIRASANITMLEKSDQTIILDNAYYTFSPRPFCPQQVFFHHTGLKCAHSLGQSMENDTQFEPPVMSSSTVPPDTLPPSPASCPPSIVGGEEEESAQTSRLVSVLLPSLILPIFVAVLLVIAAVIMTCGRSRKPGKNQRGKVPETASMENMAGPVVTPPTPVKESTTKETNRVPPMRPPPPTLHPPKQRPTSPLPAVPAAVDNTTPSHANRFSQDLYEDIADSALEGYTMSNNDMYFANPDAASIGGEGILDRPSHQNGPVSKRDDTAHYKNAALISISDRTTPMLVFKKTAASLPSLIDPKYYHDAVSPQRRANEAPGAVRSTQQNDGDHYDTLAQKKPNPTYYNHTEKGSTLALLVEDDEPDYDEVADDEEDSSRVRGGSEGQAAAGTRQPNKSFAANKILNAVRNQNTVSVMSESYEDMSGMEDFIESYKSGTVAVSAL